MKFIKVTVFCFTSWVLAALQTAVLCGLYLRYDGALELNEQDTIMLIFFSFVFSIPALFLYWLYFFSCVCVENAGGRALFRRLMRASFWLSLVSGIVGYYSLRRELGQHPGSSYPLL